MALWDLAGKALGLPIHRLMVNHSPPFARRRTPAGTTSLLGNPALPDLSLEIFLQYRLGLPEETVSSSLVFGGSVHRAIEFHFRELLSGNPPPISDALLAEFWEGWKERDLDEVRFNKGEDRDIAGSLGGRSCRLSAKRRCPARGQILAVEEELRGLWSLAAPTCLAASI